MGSPLLPDPSASQLDRLLDLLAYELPAGAMGVMERRRAEHVVTQLEMPPDEVAMPTWFRAHGPELRWALVALLARDERQAEGVGRALEIWQAGLSSAVHVDGVGTTAPVAGTSIVVPPVWPQHENRGGVDDERGSRRRGWLLAAVVLIGVGWILWPSPPVSPDGSAEYAIAEGSTADDHAAEPSGTTSDSTPAAETPAAETPAVATTAAAANEPASEHGRRLGDTSTIAADASTSDAPTSAGQATNRAFVRLVEVQVPVLRIVGPERWRWVLVAGVVSLLVFVVALVHVLRKPLELPPADGEAARHEGVPSGEQWQPPPRLLDRQAQDALVWGVAHQVSETETEHLDVERTVEATAEAGGTFELRFEYLREYRRVWLWIDQAAEGASRMLIERLADDLQATLEAAELPVSRASFDGLPDSLWQSDGSVQRVQDADHQGRRACVVVLTDGIGILRAAAAGGRARLMLDRTLAIMASWDRLMFVEMRANHGRLAGVLHPWGLECVRPTDVVNHLIAANHRAGADWIGPDLARWQVACMFAPGGLTGEEALSLRTALRLDIDRFALAQVWQTADPRAHHMRWSTTQRAVQLLRYRAGHVAEWSIAAVEREPLLRGALKHWRRWYESRGRVVEAAVIQLWTEPEPAAETLRTLYHDPEHRGFIEIALADLAPADLVDEGYHCVVLPWRLDEQAPHVQAWLSRMGLARDIAGRPTGVRRPGRWGAALGLALGTALAALGVALAGLGAEPRIVWKDGFPRGEVCRPAELGAPEQFVCEAPFDSGRRKADVGRGARVEVFWKDERIPCEEVLEDRVVLRCRSSGEGADSSGVQRTVVQVHLRASTDDGEARLLAQALLDGGKAHAVVIGPADDSLEDAFGRGSTEVQRARRVLDREAIIEKLRDLDTKGRGDTDQHDDEARQGQPSMP